MTAAELGDLANCLPEIIAKHGIIVMDHIDLTNEGFMHLLVAAGDVVQPYRQSVQSPVSVLDSSSTLPVEGGGELPFHRDGDSLDYLIDYVFLYCKEQQGESSIYTTFVDYKGANAELPGNIRSILGERVFLTTFSGGNTVSYTPLCSETGLLNLYFPGVRGSPWDTRIEGLDEQSSCIFFSELKTYYVNSKWFYRHSWVPGQLLIFDNIRYLHARERGSSFGRRVAWRGQVKSNS